MDIGTISLPIVGIQHVVVGDRLENNYTIAEEALVIENPWYNEKQAGLSLKGSVLRPVGDKVAILLDIPDDGDERAYLFKYAPITNNGMYAMPPKGTSIALEWQSAKEGDIKAIHTVRDGAQLPENYECRSLITEHERQLHMGPKQLAFFSAGNRFVLNDGIQIGTNSELVLRASKNTTISAKRKLRMKSLEEIFIAKTGIISSIWMKSREIHIKSDNTTVHSDGSGELLPQQYREPLLQVSLKAGTLASSIGSVPQKIEAGK